mmetsp:Transcript_21888/g.55134  ORF Transcript_21888/g.55134 Transcript_21888/m.55134 type:complete len:591 (+) Transcript_21888:7655-9427(+)
MLFEELLPRVFAALCDVSGGEGDGADVEEKPARQAATDRRGVEAKGEGEDTWNHEARAPEYADSDGASGARDRCGVRVWGAGGFREADFRHRGPLGGDGDRVERRVATHLHVLPHRDAQRFRVYRRADQDYLRRDVRDRQLLPCTVRGVLLPLRADHGERVLRAVGGAGGGVLPEAGVRRTRNAVAEFYARDSIHLPGHTELPGNHNRDVHHDDPGGAPGPETVGRQRAGTGHRRNHDTGKLPRPGRGEGCSRLHSFCSHSRFLHRWHCRCLPRRGAAAQAARRPRHRRRLHDHFGAAALYLHPFRFLRRHHLRAVGRGLHREPGGDPDQGHLSPRQDPGLRRPCPGRVQGRAGAHPEGAAAAGVRDPERDRRAAADLPPRRDRDRGGVWGPGAPGLHRAAGAADDPERGGAGGAAVGRGGGDRATTQGPAGERGDPVRERAEGHAGGGADFRGQNGVHELDRAGELSEPEPEPDRREDVEHGKNKERNAAAGDDRGPSNGGAAGTGEPGGGKAAATGAAGRARRRGRRPGAGRRRGGGRPGGRRRSRRNRRREGGRGKDTSRRPAHRTRTSAEGRSTAVFLRRNRAPMV